VLRDPSGQVVRIVEARDATTDELGVTEVNPSLYCVDAAWLWNAIGELEASGAQGEVLLTDIVPLALRSGRYVNTVPIENALEAVGANSPEQLKILEAVANRLERRTA
jgi:bifunctional UDP-N-acetylglucosamine pyrophosphorylase/glucosamine-1-phosphate N-acetyltransferase